MTELEPLIRHSMRMQEAILCLCKNDHRVAGLMLFYAAMDQMAWLTIPGDDDVKGRDFIDWIEKYMPLKDDKQLAKLTPTDLWGARCGYLHTASPESSSLRKGTAKSQIAHSYGPVVATSLVEGTVAVRFESLVAAFLTAVLRFRDDLNGNPSRKEVADKKLARMSQDWTI